MTTSRRFSHHRSHDGLSQHKAGILNELAHHKVFQLPPGCTPLILLDFDYLSHLQFIISLSLSFSASQKPPPPPRLLLLLCHYNDADTSGIVCVCGGNRERYNSSAPVVVSEVVSYTRVLTGTHMRWKPHPTHRL